MVLKEARKVRQKPGIQSLEMALVFCTVAQYCEAITLESTQIIPN